MPRKSAAKKEEPSSDEASAHSDVEMQDQPDDTMNGFKKFGVSATPVCAFLAATLTCQAGGRRDHEKTLANIPDAVQCGYPRLHSTMTPTPRHTHSTQQLTRAQDSDTNPNTTANSVAGDAPVDGRRKRAEEMNMRKSMYGKKAEGLRASKVRDITAHYIPRHH